MSESNCRGWAIISRAKKGQYRQCRRFLSFTPGFNRVVMLTSSYSQNRFNGFHSRDPDKPLKRLKEIRCERRGHPVETG